MPIYEYYCAQCDTEYEVMRSVSQIDEPAPCQVCGHPGRRQLSTFSFKSNTFTAPHLKPAKGKPFRSHNRGAAKEPSAGKASE